MVDRLANTEGNRVRIESVENAFGISGSKLLIPGRVLVGEGVLTKICRKRPKPRQFFLFNDIMVYGNILINKKKYNKQHIIPLEGVTLEDLKDEETNVVQNKNGWLIKTPHKSFAVYAATSTEKIEWMAHIEKCIRDLITRTGRAPSTGHAAVWIPDTEVSKCMHCEKTAFTILNRRHHCRNCGSVVCGNCSKNKFLIPSQSKTPVRVCDTCFNGLGNARTNFFGQRDSSGGADSSGGTLDDADPNGGETPGGAETSGGEVLVGDTSISSEPGDATPVKNGANRGLSDTEESSDDEDGANPKLASSSLEGKMDALEIDSKPQFYDQNESVGSIDEADAKPEADAKQVDANGEAEAKQADANGKAEAKQVDANGKAEAEGVEEKIAAESSKVMD